MQDLKDAFLGLVYIILISLALLLIGVVLSKPADNTPAVQDNSPNSIVLPN